MNGNRKNGKTRNYQAEAYRMKALLDSNILIYLGTDKAAQIENVLANNELNVSIISKVETLGYHKLSDKEKKFLNMIFERINVIHLDEDIIKSAIHIKQQRKTSLGDALIAATALTKKLTLVTNNTDDFKNIRGLKLIDPLTGVL